MNIAVVTAMQEEADLMMSRIKKVPRSYSGSRVESIEDWNTGITYHLLITGIGKVAASVYLSKLLNNEPNIDYIINIGFAAGTTDFNVGEVVNPTVCKQWDLNIPDSINTNKNEYYPSRIPFTSGNIIPCYTGDSFVTKDNVDNILTKYPDAKVFDMESFALAKVCSIYWRPFISIKVISDIPQLGNNENQFNKFISQAHSDLFSKFDEVVSGLI